MARTFEQETLSNIQTMLYLGKPLDVLKFMESDSIDACVTDASRVLDSGVPDEEHWAEVLRVMKPGSHLVVFGGDAWVEVTHRIRNVGFNTCEEFLWFQEAGYPLVTDVRRVIYGSTEAEEGPTNQSSRPNWITRIFRVQPQHIVLAQKPLMGSIDENVGTYGTGLLNTRKAADQRGYSNIIYAATDNPGDRFRIAQPAMKPIYLMQWLVRLVTPTGGTVLDPFAGTGATAEAALREGCSCILIAEDEDHRNGIRRRFAAGDAD